MYVPYVLHIPKILSFQYQRSCDLPLRSPLVEDLQQFLMLVCFNRENPPIVFCVNMDKKFEILEDIKGTQYELYSEDFNILEQGHPLNDRVINAYFALLEAYSCDTLHIFSTFFYTIMEKRGIEWVQRWTLAMNIFSNRLIYIPIHLPGHWILTVTDTESMTLEYYDSLGGVNQGVIGDVQKYLRTEWRRIYGENIEFITSIKTLVPLQKNEYDCGVFVCMFGRYRLCKAVGWLCQKHIPMFRKKMAKELISGRVDDIGALCCSPEKPYS